jgi:hypothetical protein
MLYVQKGKARVMTQRLGLASRILESRIVLLLGTLPTSEFLIYSIFIRIDRRSFAGSSLVSRRSLADSRSKSSFPSCHHVSRVTRPRSTRVSSLSNTLIPDRFRVPLRIAAFCFLSPACFLSLITHCTSNRMTKRQPDPPS